LINKEDAIEHTLKPKPTTTPDDQQEQRMVTTTITLRWQVLCNMQVTRPALLLCVTCKHNIFAT